MAKTEVMASSEATADSLARAREIMKEKGITYTKLAQSIGKDPMFVAAALHGQHKLTFSDVEKISQTLGLDSETKKAFLRYPVRVNYPTETDPFKYRILEAIALYGDAMREVFNELFADEIGRGGDGIMSAIDFSLKMERVTGSHGEPRLRIIMDGKYLEYKEF
ncbi:MAG TPA: helix-turn-helix domain-containing protein [Nitrososphaeraceae archaeon]|jgi:cyanate lyase|nr:helix-turn-helix domain-containing protein [Nitrososphaeraceae archaeon]